MSKNCYMVNPDLKLEFSAYMFSVPTTAVGLGVSFIFVATEALPISTRWEFAGGHSVDHGDFFTRWQSGRH